MIEAGCEECKPAIERKDVHEGVTCYHCDCRSRMVKKIPSTLTSSTLNQGWGVITGFYTQKPLHIGIRKNIAQHVQEELKTTYV